jgi:formylmethanofuran dehydrogenase subunit E
VAPIDRGMKLLAETVIGPYIEPLGRMHRVLCPRQVLGVRVALLGGRVLDLPLPQVDKRTIVVPEIDGCFADGLMAATNCSVGHRTMRLVDFGKIAATVVDTATGRALRVTPRPGIRVAACAYADGETRRWHAQRLGYARMPDAELLSVQPVPLPDAVAPLLGPLDKRTVCVRCGEEVFNDRQIRLAGRDICRGCLTEQER